MKLRLLLLLALAALARGQGELTVDQALELAMRQNPAVQAIYRQVDMSEAEQDQASLLVNPVFSASVGLPDQAGAQNRTEFALSWNLLDLLRRSDRQELASTRVRQARYQVQDSLLDLIFEVREAYYELQEKSQSLEQLEIVLQAARAATELHKRQFEAGNIPKVALAQQEAAELEARIALEQAGYQLEQARARLNVLLGQPSVEPVKVPRLAELPETETALDGLEELALEQRPDLALAALEVEADRQELTLAAGGLLDEVSFGVVRETESEVGAPTVTGPELQFPVPLFDRRQGQTAHFRYKTEQSQRLLESRQQKIRAEVRIAVSQLRAARLKVERLRDQMIPKRREILLLSRPYFDSMLLGVYPLLQLRQDLARTRLELLEAIAHYWTARARLERALGGRL